MPRGRAIARSVLYNLHSDISKYRLHRQDETELINLYNTLKPYIIVFSASACTLIIEIVAGRILAPTIGVSLYTWTSIIGIVLAGISLGNYLGGRIADRYPYPRDPWHHTSGERSHEHRDSAHRPLCL